MKRQAVVLLSRGQTAVMILLKILVRIVARRNGETKNDEESKHGAASNATVFSKEWSLWVVVVEGVVVLGMAILLSEEVKLQLPIPTHLRNPLPR